MTHNRLQKLYLPWDIENDGDIHKIVNVGNKEFLYYNKFLADIGLENNNVPLLTHVLAGLKKIERHQLPFYLDNFQEIENLCSKIRVALKRKYVDLVSTSDNTEVASVIPTYLGNYRWSTGPSILDQVD